MISRDLGQGHFLKMNDRADSALGQPPLMAGSPSPARLQGSLALDLEMRQGQQGLALASTPSPPRSRSQVSISWRGGMTG